jgi:hypothetical protein
MLEVLIVMCIVLIFRQFIPVVYTQYKIQADAFDKQIYLSER